jgi:hypothetical protein
MTKMSLNIAKTLIHGAVVGLNAYIKPGGIHRYSPGTLFDEVLCNLIFITGNVADAIELGDKVRRGELAASSIGYKKLLVDPLKEVFRTCNIVHPQFIVPLIIGGVVLGISGVESILEESSKFKRALELIMLNGAWSDIKNFIDALRTIGRHDMYDHLKESSYVDIAILKTSVNLNEICKALGSRWKGFLIIEIHEGMLFTYLKRLQEIYKSERSLYHSIIKLYMELIKPYIPSTLIERVKNAELCGYMKTQECAKIMYELELLFRKSKLVFNDISEVVILIAAFGSFEGLK